MKKTGIRVVLIAVIILMCLCCDGLLMVHYNYKKQKLYNLETPLDIANEYMQPKYEGRWRRLNDVFYAGKNERERTYEVGRRMGNI